MGQSDNETVATEADLTTRRWPTRLHIVIRSGIDAREGATAAFGHLPNPWSKRFKPLATTSAMSAEESLLAAGSRLFSLALNGSRT